MKKTALIPFHFLSFLVFLALESLARVYPLGDCIRIGQGLGWIVHLCWPGGRNQVRRNLARAYSSRMSRDEINSLARRHFEKRGGNLMAGLRILLMPEGEIEKKVSYEGVNNLEKALAAGKGVIAALSDGANRELYARIRPAGRKLPWGALHLTTGNPFIDQHLAILRAEAGVRLFETSQGLAPALRWIRENGVLGIFVDQCPGSGGVLTPFCGRLTPASPSAAVLALRTGAPIVFAEIEEQGEGSWKVVFHEPMFPPDEPGIKQAWLLDTTAKLNRAVTEAIHRQPENGSWLHRRFEFSGRDVFPGRRKTRIALAPGTSIRDEVSPFCFLVRSANPLGDACMSIPAVRAIKASRPDAHVTILCRSNLEPLWRNVSEVDDVIAIPGKSSWRDTGKLIRQRRRCYDTALLFPNSTSSALEVRAGGIRAVYGYRGHHRQWLMTRCIAEPVAEPPTHHLERYLHLVAQMGAPVAEHRDQFLTLPPAPAPILPGQKAWKMAICPGAEFGNAKRWPLERYASAIEELRRRRDGESIAVTIVGSPAERDLGDALAARIPEPRENLAGKTSIGDLIEHLKTRHLVVSNDTGTMHLAAALGIPVVAIFGSTEPVLTSPVGGIHRVIREKVECSPCFKRECPIDFRCMTRISVERVVGEILALMNKKGEKSTP